MPCDNPRFAYVVLYEGRAHERLGGGAAAAPIVKEFFETEKKDIKAIIDPPKDDIPVAEPVEETPETAAAALRERSGAPAVVPDNLPPGLYDPEGMGMPGRRRPRCRRSLLRPPSRRAGETPITFPGCPSRFPAISTAPLP